MLVADAYGNSRVEPDENRILTGEKGGFPMTLGSLFHELVHLFNFSVEGGVQDFWSGELFAQYHAERLETSGLEHKARYAALFKERRPQWKWIGQLDRDFARLSEAERETLMSLGVSIYWYLEDEFGAEKVACFWRAHLFPAERDGAWEACFGRDEAALRAGWRRYYGLGR